MVNVKNINISQDGGIKKISVMWDELTENGRILGTNNRMTRAVTDQSILDAIEIIENYAKTAIEEG